MGRVLKAKYSGTCSERTCNKPLAEGDWIIRQWGGWAHIHCAKRLHHDYTLPLGGPTQPVRTKPSIPTKHQPTVTAGSTCDCGIFVAAGREALHDCP